MNKIIKVSNKKIKQNNEDEHIEKLKKQILELEEETKTTKNRTSDYANNKQKIDDAYIMANTNNTAVSILTNRVSSAEQNISNLSSANTTNAQNITALSGQVSNHTTSINTLSSDLSSHVQDYNSLNERFLNVVQVVGQHGGRIMDIDASIIQLQLYKQDKLTAGTGISIDENNVISSSGGSGSCNCASDIANLQSNVSTLNSKVATLESKIKKLMPDYLETVYKETDNYERELDISAQKQVYTPSVLFAMSDYLSYVDDENTTIKDYQKASLTINLNYSVSTADTITFDVYNKSTLITSLPVVIEQNKANQTQTFTIKTSISATEKNQNIYIVCTSVSDSTTINLSYFNLSIKAPNVSILNKIQPFEVVYHYYTNKYYFSDCRTGYAKIAEIDANEFTSLNDLVWTQTNIEAQNYKTYIVPTSTTSSPNESSVVWVRYALIIHKNNTAEIINYNDSTKRYSYPVGTFKLEPFPTRNGYMMVNYICVNKNVVTTTYNIIQHNMTVSTIIHFINPDNNANISASRNNLPFISFGATWVHLLVTANTGNCRFYVNRTSPTNPEVLFDFTQDSKLYLYKFVSEFNMNYRFYFKKFDKFYCKEAGVNSASIYPENGCTEIGEYDDLFEGLNKDLFVVANNELYYLKNQN